MQATPTEDTTVTTLNKEKLAQEVQQLKNQNEPDLLGWLRTNASILLSTLVVVIGGLIGLFRWLGDRRDEYEKRREDQRNEQEKRAEERFQAAVTGLGDEKKGAKIGAAILLRTFLRPGYEEFYTQTFDLAVAHLRLPTTPDSPEDPTSSLPLTTLSQALIVVFKEAFPLARSQNKGSPQSLDATGIQLDNAYMSKADLRQVWTPRASLRKVDLSKADLNEANLSGADLNEANLRKAELDGTNLNKANLDEANLSGAKLNKANLSKANLNKANLNGANLAEADLIGAELIAASLVGVDLSWSDLSGANLSEAELIEVNLSGADLTWSNLRRANLSRANLNKVKLIWADLSEANLRRADLSEAKLIGAKLSGARLIGANLSGADLSRIKFVMVEHSGTNLSEDNRINTQHGGADLSGADLSGADLSGADLSGANLDNALSLKDINLHEVSGLTKDQLEICKAKGATIDEGYTTNSSQSTTLTPLPLQSNDVQTQSALTAQESIPTSDTSGSSAAASSQQGSGS